MDQGDFLRHRARPEWGIGQVLLKADDRLEVQFNHGLVPLKLSIASAYLEKVSKAEAVAAGVATVTRRTGPAKTASGQRKPPKSEKRSPKAEPAGA
jgi:hypothetical protein